MAKYTFKDIIIDPEDERLKDAIGKKVYFGNNPQLTLNEARNDEDLGTLSSIEVKNAFPFSINGTGLLANDLYGGYICIILKKEEPKVKYVPFDLSKKEDRDALRGKWIKHKRYGTEILIDCFSLDTGKWYVNGYSAKPLFCNFLFLDGSPVGKKVEE